MKKIFNVFAFLLVVVLMNSCNTKNSLQSYLVETSGKEGFYTADIPVSSVLSVESDVAMDVQETMKSVKKINVVFLPKTAANEAVFTIEKNKLKSIFKNNDTYKSLMTMKLQEMNVSVFYAGKTAAINEIVAFGYGDANGVGVVRLLGDNMDPTKIITLLNNVSMSKNGLDDIKNVFNII